MRLHKIRTYYRHYLREFYTARPCLERRPYATQFRELMSDCFGASDFWSEALKRHGYETFETIANVEPMQRQWAEENGVTVEADASAWTLDVAAEQIKRFRPTVLFVADYAAFDAAFLRRIKADNPSIRCVVAWCGAPYRDPAIFRECTAVLSCVPELVADFRAQGLTAFHLDHVFAPQILERIDTQRAPTIDFSFIGSIFKDRGFHHERERLLLHLSEYTNLEIFADVSLSHAASVVRGTQLRAFVYDLVQAARGGGVPDTLLAALPVFGRAARWQERPHLPPVPDARLAQRARGAVWGRAMYQRLRDSKISLNSHIDISPHSASNMRLFEATGVGSCLLTDWRENIRSLFEPDTEIVTYRSAEECVEKARYLLEHEDTRREIASCGQRRTLREHTYTQWAEKFDGIIRQVLSSA